MNSKIRLIFVLLLGALIVTAAWFFLSQLAVPEVRNVVLISIDTCRADHLSCYGYSRKTTPNIDAVAADGILFENVVSPVPLTLPAHTSMLTGTIPPYHGVHDNLGYRLGESNLVLAEILKGNGFTTGAVIGAFILDSQFGLDQGFNYYNDEFEEKIDGLMIAQRQGEEVSRFACNWLSKNKDGQFFLFLHYYDPHFPYEPPESFKSTYLFDEYSGEIAYTDHCISRVIEKLKELKLYDSTLLVITSDHGESLGEHCEVTHGYFIYEGSIKVPLIFKLPGGSKGQRFSDVVGLIDIMPTVLSILGIEVPEEVQGKDLSRCFGRRRALEEERVVFCGSLLPTKYRCNSLLGVVSDDWKYIQTTRPELYDLKNDPEEMNNLVDGQPHRARFMQDKLKQILETQVRTAGDGKELHLDQKSVERLESLGYVSTGRLDESFEFNQTKDDPKDYTTYHADQYHVLQLIREKKFEQAREICGRMISEHPNVAYAYFLFGKVAFAEDKFDEAITYHSRALELEPDFRSARCRLGSACAQMGEFADAIAHWNEALRLWEDDLRVHIDIADSLIRLGRVDEAIEHWNKSLELKPDQPDIHDKLAIRYYQQRRVADAVRHWNEALKLHPDWSKVLNDLAWIYATEKQSQFYRPSEAIELAERACELTHYKRPEALDTLSAAYAAVGRFSEAIETAQKALDLARSVNRQKLAKEIESHLKRYERGRF
jgi:arylsulfatase A-like enzyme/Flp pilus assembly protein TadD